MLHRFWPELLEQRYLQDFNTYLIKATHKDGRKECFFDRRAYDDWLASMPAAEARAWGKPGGWTTKYYKGLGTSNSAEAKVRLRVGLG